MKVSKARKPRLRATIKPYHGIIKDAKWYWTVQAKKHWWDIWQHVDAPFETSGFTATNSEAVAASKEAITQFETWRQQTAYVSRVTRKDVGHESC